MLKDDGVGLITSQTGANYLLLDSLEYWYDLIQMGYPKKRKCSCKNEWFVIRIEYELREGTADYLAVKVKATCTACGKASTALSIDLNYSPTEHLFLQPITFCEKPKISYRLSQLTSYWNADDLQAFLNFFFHDLQLHVYCWFFKHPEGKRYFEKVTYEKAKEIITVTHKYLEFYFSLQEMELSQFITGSDEKGVYLKQNPWRKNELIELSAPIHMMGYGLIFYIRYCTQHLHRGITVDKSEAFATITGRLEKWLKGSFVTKRGKHCYDGEATYAKFIAKRNEV